MVRLPQHNSETQQAAALAGDARAIKHLKDQVRVGKSWYAALLEAINLWRSPEEEYKGERYLYLVGGQAFDWLRLAERLCDEIREAIHRSVNDEIVKSFPQGRPKALQGVHKEDLIEFVHVIFIQDEGI